MSSRQPSKITRSSSQRDQLGPQNVALNQRRLALLRYVLSLLPPKNPSAAIKHPSNNGKDIVKNAAASSPIDHDHIGERRRQELGHDHDQEQPRSRRCTFELASSSREVDCWISKKTKKKNRADEGIGAFLQRCVLCNKFIDGHIYMYGCLRAFCSPECRDYQIELDGFDKQVEAEFVKFLCENRIRVLAPR